MAALTTPHPDSTLQAVQCMPLLLVHPCVTALASLPSPKSKGNLHQNVQTRTSGHDRKAAHLPKFLSLRTCKSTVWQQAVNGPLPSVLFSIR